MRLTNKNFVTKLLALIGISFILASCATTNSYTPRKVGLTQVPNEFIYKNYLELIAQTDGQPTLDPSVFANNNTYLVTITKGNDVRQVVKPIPGAYALAGYASLLKSEYTQAYMYFKKELQTYPESKKYIDMLIKKIPKKYQK